MQLFPKDIQPGVFVYTAHPVFGITWVEVNSVPYEDEHGFSVYDSTFSGDVDYSDNGEFSINPPFISSERKSFLNDDGITDGATYNDRRSFDNPQEAVDYALKMKDDPGFKVRHARHLEFCKTLEYELDICDYDMDMDD